MCPNCAPKKIMSLIENLTLLHMRATWKSKLNEWAISLQTIHTWLAFWDIIGKMTENQSPQQFSHQLQNADCLSVAVKVPRLSNQKPPQLFTTCDQSHSYGKQLYRNSFQYPPFSTVLASLLHSRIPGNKLQTLSFLIHPWWTAATS